jgi:hypothetical protein
MKQARSLIRSGFLSVVALLGACSTVATGGVSLSSVRVFDEDTSRRYLAARHDEVDAIAKSIRVADVQEIFGVRESSRIAVQVAAGEQTGDKVAAPAIPSAAAPSLPAAPTGSVGRTRNAILTSLIADGDIQHGYRLLFGGDAEFADPAKRVYLLRLDVGILQETDTDADSFLMGQFKVSETTDTWMVRVYALGPEYSSLVAQESWISSHLSEFAGSLGYPVGSLDLQVAAQRQQATEESFLSLVERPLEFSAYGPGPDEFRFGFGPHRMIVKRSWINPARIFGDTYRIDYRIRAGTRPCFVVIVVEPKCKDPKEPQFTVSGEFRSKGPVPVGSISLVDGDRRAAGPSAAVSAMGRPAAKPLTLRGNQVFPATSTDILVECPGEVVVPGVDVLVGPMRLDPKDVIVVGRERLLVTIRPSLALQAILGANGPGTKVKLSVVFPGGRVAEGEVGLVASEKPKPDPDLAVSPGTGRGPLDVVVRAKSFDLTKVKGVSVDGIRLQPNLGWSMQTPAGGGPPVLVVRLPPPPKGSVDHQVSIWLHGADDTVLFYLENVFTYAN